MTGLEMDAPNRRALVTRMQVLLEPGEGLDLLFPACRDPLPVVSGVHAPLSLPSRRDVDPKGLSPKYGRDTDVFLAGGSWRKNERLRPFLMGRKYFKVPFFALRVYYDFHSASDERWTKASGRKDRRCGCEARLRLARGYEVPAPQARVVRNRLTQTAIESTRRR